VAGRTRATSTPSGPRPPSPPDDDPGPEHGPQDPGERDDAGEPAAEVIPLPIFDARKEAEQWRF
jgi:putative transposase